MDKTFLEGLSKGLRTFLSVKLDSSLSRVEHEITKRVYRIKRTLFRSVVELFFLLMGVAFFIIGLILFLARYIALEYVLLVGGIIMLYVVLLFTKFR